MVNIFLKIDNIIDNKDLPVALGGNPEKLERELILKQLLYLRQDVNEVKQILFGEKVKNAKNMQPANSALYLPPSGDKVNDNATNYDNIEEAGITGLKEEAVGEMTLDELEKEVIEKYLKKFNNNRRITANALNISERTLYRKIKEYEIK